jgi:hemoglobin
MQPVDNEALMESVDTQVTEQQISELVSRFYESAATDESLQAIFAAAIHDWDSHHRVVADFWSHALLNTDRYHGSPYQMHARLPLRIEHFDSWLTHFRRIAREVLPTIAAEKVIGRAEHMAESFKLGMFFDYNPSAVVSFSKAAE